VDILALLGEDVGL
jgi:hypothetical protein